jgi:hypothetical protein
VTGEVSDVDHDDASIMLDDTPLDASDGHVTCWWQKENRGQCVADEASQRERSAVVKTHLRTVRHQSPGYLRAFSD